MQMLFDKTCVLCRTENMVLRKKKVGFNEASYYLCENCGSAFIEDELRWKLVETKDRQNPIWQEFNQKSLYVREWLTIAGLTPGKSLFDNLEVPMPVF